MTQSERLFVIHYTDGRVEGPLGAKVILDLIKAQVVSSQDQVAPEGGAPMPWTSFPEFAGAGQAPSLRSASTTQRTARGLRVSGAMPTVRRPSGPQPAVRAPRSTGPQAVLSGQATAPPAGPPPMAPRSPERRPQAEPRAVASARPPQPKGGHKPTRFHDSMLALGPVAMRDQLLTSDLPSIVGVPFEAPERMVKQSAYDRAFQVRHAFKPKAAEEQLAIVDMVNIILEAQAILSDPRKKSAYEQERDPRDNLRSFQNAARFQFAEAKNIVKTVRTAEARLAALAVTATPEVELEEGPVSFDSPPSSAAMEALSSSRARSTASANSGSSIAARLARSRRTSGQARIRTGDAPPPPTHRSSSGQPGVPRVSTQEIPHLAQELGSLGGGHDEVPSQNWITDDDLPSLDTLLPSGDVATGAVAGVIDKIRSSQELPQIDDLSSHAQDFTFPQDWIEEGPEALRDQLFTIPLHEIVGVPEGFQDEQLDEAAQVRLAQLQSAFHPGTRDFEDQLIITDIVEIIHKSYAVLADAEAMQGYRQARQSQGRWPSFQNFVQFSFAETSLFSAGVTADAGFSQVRRARRLSNVGRITDSQRAMRLSQQVPQQSGRATEERPIMPGRSTGPQRVASITGEQAALENLQGLTESGPTPALARSAPTDAELDAITANLSGSTSGHKGKKSKKTPDRFKGAEFSEDGDAFKGKLVFGVGKPARGLIYTLPVYGLVFLVSLVMVTAMGYGEKEMTLTGDDQMFMIRNGMLLGLGFLGVVALRRENPLRIGLVPRFLPVLPALVIAGIIGYAARELAPFSLEQGATLDQVSTLLIFRALAEVVFFHGFLTRTLLIEFKNVITAVMFSALLYGLYSATYAELYQGSVFGSVYAIFIYTFGLGMPMAMIYSQTRSVLVAFACQFFILLMSAMGGLEKLEQLLQLRNLEG